MAYTYSFLDVQCAIVGPGIATGINLGGTGVADEGITISMAEDKNTMTLGADGGGMHSLHASNAGRVTIRLLKTNPLNFLLSAAYNYQKATAGQWGQNTISIRNPVRGDIAVAGDAAFIRQPDFVNSKDGGIVEWAFDAIFVQEIMGNGTPNAA